jgi:hypothetical protein
MKELAEKPNKNLNRAVTRWLLIRNFSQQVFAAYVKS